MKLISIERALVWAYCEQMVHVAVKQGTPTELSRDYSPGRAEGAFLADKIDSGVKVGFAAHADAYAIDSAVKRLQPVAIARGRDEMEMLFARRLLKNDFDSHDRRAAGDATRPSPTVHMMPRALVQQHAMAANQPDRCEAPTIAYEQGKRVYTNRNGGVVLHKTKFGFNLIDWVGDDPLEVIALRRTYAVWHGALVYLRQALDGGLQAHRLNADLPPPPVPS